MEGRSFNVPRASPSAKKYNDSVIYQENALRNWNLPPSISNTLQKSANFSLAAKTKGTYSTAFNMLKKCKEDFPDSLNFPLSERDILIYIGWNINRGLKANSIKSYLSGLKTIHRANGWGELVIDTPLINCVLKGQVNLNIEQAKDFTEANKRLPCTLEILKLLKQEIRLSDLNNHDKIVVWSTCSLLFYGALRGGGVTM